MALVDEIRDGTDVAFDTDALIYFVETHQIFLRVVEPVIEMVYSQRAQGHVSAINLLEVLVRPFREDRPDLSDTYRIALTTDPRMRMHTVTAAIAERAARIRAAHRIEVADSIIAANAIEAGCSYLITNNGDDFQRYRAFRHLSSKTTSLNWRTHGAQESNHRWRRSDRGHHGLPPGS